MDGDLNWKVGTAVVEITPKESMWLAGWAARREPASGTATPLYAKALAIQDAAGTTLVICTVDLIAITREIVNPVAELIFEKHGILREHLLFNASHTHTGPEIRIDKAPFFGIPEEFAAKIPKYNEELKQNLVQVIGEALASIEPASLYVTSTRCDIAENRRKPPGPVDYDVPILIATDEKNYIHSVAFGYACHNLTLPPTFVQYCAEFSGEAVEQVDVMFLSDPIFYLSGAGADLDPRKTPLEADPTEIQTDLTLTQSHGYALGDAVYSGVMEPSLRKTLAGPLRIAYSETPLDFEPLRSREQLEADLTCDDPPKRTKARFLLDAIDSGRPLPTSYPCPLQVISFGDELLLIAMSAEPVVQFALDFKKQYGPGMVWVAGYCNDMFGYIATQEIQEQGGYEGGRATLWSALPGPFTRATERRVREAVDALVRRVRHSPDS
ncbi:MAG: hypothetical protein ACR2IE_08160 [Candidatus Sumerlaeaceae bacterium]